ncbi:MULTISPECIES: hypothetical protein [unclassified Polaribacter]|uniref:hypothetical protein n=1 Tax=unclassified Polaribacter TaxID=196858 RepID=UPI0011BDA4F2|nr:MULTISPECIES: hypothetical protein [unclassified Polaribacter]TXD54342.1 hypothetical protein ES043_00370 [Polaribacter sp. IC063]TXD62827.1 hypothetical protein ES044_00390 [Polaribacter sp. IC066]
MGIIIDQMRCDYLTLFSDRDAENGFKRLINDEFSIENKNYNNSPVSKAITARALQTTKFTDGIMNSLQNGYHQNFW